MPELPEVEAARLIARRVAVGRRIVGVWCAADSIGFELDRRPWPCLHVGMTGGFHVRGQRGVKLVSSGDPPRGGEWPPRFAKLRLTFDDGGELVFADARRLGRVRLRHDPAAEPPISLLGFDALLGVPPPRGFAALLRGRSAPIKAVLLDQSVAAGVGNWIAD